MPHSQEPEAGNNAMQMKTSLKRLLPLTLLLTLSPILYAQNPQGEPSSNSLLLMMAAVVVLIVFFVIVQVADNLLRIEAKKLGVDKKAENVSLFPSLNEIVRKKLPDYVGDAHVTDLRKGFDIRLEGTAPTHINGRIKAHTFAVQPPNFRGISPIPKLEVEVGQRVKAGDPLFHDKVLTAVKFVAPVSGEVVAINRGERRAITEVVIQADKDIEYRQLPKLDPEACSREELVNYLMETGGWTLLRQRPYDVIADPACVPANIFISTFDTAPLAPDNNFVVNGREEAFQRGLDVLNRLTSGKVYLGLSANGETPPAKAFTDAKGVEKRWFRGPHPAGNVGIQIHHIDPIKPNGEVWTLGVQEVITLGALFTEGRFNAERVVAITGAELKEPTYVRTYIGANVGDLVKNNLANDHVRFISGDVLSGRKKGLENFLDFYDDQLTVVLEGDYYEMFGWLLPSKLTPSMSRTFPNFLFPDATYRADTNMHGEKRAFVVTGQYEAVLPMDILPQHLMKAILTNDYDRMEGLGIYELIEEDVALCEFVCTSKQPLQKILRRGLDMMREQG